MSATDRPHGAAVSDGQLSLTSAKIRDWHRQRKALVYIRQSTPQQVLEAFRPLIDYRAQRDASYRAALYEQLLRAIAVHRVADRPDRFEPRMAKRRPKRYDRLTRPRAEIKLRMLK